MKFNKKAWESNEFAAKFATYAVISPRGNRYIERATSEEDAIRMVALKIEPNPNFEKYRSEKLCN